jgi:hypothetical protein
MKPQFGKLRNDGPDLCTSADDFLDVPLGHLLRPVEAALLKGVMRYVRGNNFELSLRWDTWDGGQRKPAALDLTLAALPPEKNGNYLFFRNYNLRKIILDGIGGYEADQYSDQRAEDVALALEKLAKDIRKLRKAQ